MFYNHIFLYHQVLIIHTSIDCHKCEKHWHSPTVTERHSKMISAQSIFPLTINTFRCHPQTQASVLKAPLCLLPWIWIAYVSIPIHDYKSLYFVQTEAYLYDSGVTGPSVLCCRLAQTDSKTGRGERGRGPVGMQLCVHCFIKINHLDKDILRRIYIEQLQKQASVCEAVMQPDHTASLNHRAGAGGFSGAHTRIHPSQ